MHKKNMYKIIIAIAVAVAFILPTSAAFANIGQPIENETIVDDTTTDNILSDIGDQPPAPLAVDWWPMFHHDLRNTGYSTSTAPDTNDVLWTYTAGNDVMTSPVVVDGKVYFGAKDRYIYCLDESTGAFNWKYSPLPGVSHELSSPTVAEGRVFFGTWYDHYIYCIDASNGAFIWKYLTGNSGTMASPTVVGGRVYIGDHDGYFHCIDVLDGTRIWKSVELGEFFANIESTAAVVDGSVFVTSWCELSGHIYCLDASDGSITWQRDTSWQSHSSPAVVDGRVFVGSVGTLYCLNALNGAIIWQKPIGTGEPSASSPAVADGRVYIGSYAGTYDKKVQCFAASDGSPIWTYTTGGSIFSSPAVADGKVYIGSGDNKVYCLDALAGTLIWSYATGGSIGHSSPAVANGKVFIGSSDNKVYCFGAEPLEYIEITTLAYKWNLVSVPFNYSVDKADIIVEYDGTDYTWADAVSAGIVADTLFGWDRTATPQQYKSYDILDPGYGYWLWAYNDCILKVLAS